MSIFLFQYLKKRKILTFISFTYDMKWFSISNTSMYLYYILTIILNTVVLFWNWQITIIYCILILFINYLKEYNHGVAMPIQYELRRLIYLMNIHMHRHSTTYKWLILSDISSVVYNLTVHRSKVKSVREFQHFIDTLLFCQWMSWLNIVMVFGSCMCV